MKTTIPQDKFLDLVNLALTTTRYTFNSQFYQQADRVKMGAPAPALLTTAEIYAQDHKHTAISTALRPIIVWERFVVDVYSILKLSSSHQKSSSKY